MTPYESTATSEPLILAPNKPKKYPSGVPHKFDPAGNIQLFPGNTIVSHLPASSDLHASLRDLHDKLKASPLAHLYALLPPSSFHMKIFEGVCDQMREPGFWPSDLPMDTPLENCTAHFADKLREFDIGEDGVPPYRLKVFRFDPIVSGIGVGVELQTLEEDRKFRGMRDRLADTLAIRHPHHDTYGLHFSVAYLLRHLTEEQETELTALLMEYLEKDFELGAPEFCTFEDMAAFERMFYLKKQG